MSSSALTLTLPQMPLVLSFRTVISRGEFFMFRIILVVALVIVCGVGCAQRQPASASSATAGDDLIHSVYQRLNADPVTTHLDLVLQSDDGIVTIYGRIDNSAARLRAVSIVRSTAGVRGVIDKTFKY